MADHVETHAHEESIPREVRIAGVAEFVRAVGVMATAEFIVDLQDAVHGLGRNNSALVAAILERKG